ncbi:hypothetical protein F4X86_01530 [Candidatus Saccharibacteria bacterium]|nr:hypothetical protein [Candidatus Saccharibacteria bacterium]
MRRNRNTFSSRDAGEAVSPRYTRRLGRAAEEILEVLGTEELTSFTDSLVVKAIIGIAESRLTDVPEDALGTITISKPEGEFAESALWSYGITYGMQDSRHSRLITIYKTDDTERFPATLSRYDGSADRHLRKSEAKAVESDLKQAIKSMRKVLPA